jgi:hypothetical protein
VDLGTNRGCVASDCDWEQIGRTVFYYQSKPRFNLVGRNFSGRRTRNPPMPFFQNSQGGGYGYAHSLQQVYNRGFTEFLQKYVCLMPDYIAVWNWFFLRFTSQVEETFNYYQEGFDMDAISNDLQELLRAYQSDLDEGYVPYTNRYRR